MTLAELDVATACRLLAQGRAVAFPTDCGYGFALDPFHPEAEVAMAQLKPGRDAPVGLIAADRSQVDPLVHRWTPIAERCAALWPAEPDLGVRGGVWAPSDGRLDRWWRRRAGAGEVSDKSACGRLWRSPDSDQLEPLGTTAGAATG